jgi:transposase
METKIEYVKSYQDKQWLAKELETKSTRQIAKEHHVSYKLINKWALNFDLIKKTPFLELP